MGVRISWSDGNTVENGHRVYRSEAPIDPESLPAPLATLGPDVTHYDDGSGVEGATYYYRVSAYAGSAEVVSDQVVVTYSSVFDPTTLFVSDEYGFTHDLLDTSTLWQDTARTIQVTAAGQIVRAIDDLSGNGIHLALAGGTGATYQFSGGVAWLDIPGDTWYISAALTEPLLYDNGGLMVAAAIDSSEGQGAILFEGNESYSDRFGLFHSTIDNGLFAIFRGVDNANNRLDLNTELDGSPAVIGVSIASNLVTGYLNNVALPSTTDITSNFESARYLYLGRYPAATAPNLLDGKYYGGVGIDRTLTPSERGDVNTWLSDRAGI